MKILKKALMLVMMAVLLNASLTTISAKTALSTIGTVAFYDESKGYGFISPDDGGANAFVHVSDVQAAGMTVLDRGQRVSYDLETDRNGKTRAVNIQPAE